MKSTTWHSRPSVGSSELMAQTPCKLFAVDEALNLDLIYRLEEMGLGKVLPLAPRAQARWRIDIGFFGRLNRRGGGLISGGIEALA